MNFKTFDRDIIIQPLQTDHLSEMIHLAKNTLEIADYDGSDYDFFSVERLQLMSASKDVQVLEALVDGQFAGFFILLLHRASGFAYIVDLAIKVPYRKLGIAKLFVERGISFARENACDEIWCIVQDQNEPALNLFRSNGFRQGKRFFYMGKRI